MISHIWIMRDYDRCVGCRLCEIACSLKHEGRIWPEASRIKIFEYAPGVFVPNLCIQCPDYPCVEKCPTKALYVDEKTGAVRVDEGRCTLCGICVEICPVGSIYVVKDKKSVIICDLCDGDPECVKTCRELGYNALEVVPRPEINTLKLYAVKPEEIGRRIGEKIMGEGAGKVI